MRNPRLSVGKPEVFRLNRIQDFNKEEAKWFFENLEELTTQQIFYHRYLKHGLMWSANCVGIKPYFTTNASGSSDQLRKEQEHKKYFLYKCKFNSVEPFFIFPQQSNSIHVTKLYGAIRILQRKSH